jgi:hypothetical protein
MMKSSVLYAADFTVRKQQYMHKLTKGFMPMAAAIGAGRRCCCCSSPTSAPSA